MQVGPRFGEGSFASDAMHLHMYKSHVIGLISKLPCCDWPGCIFTSSADPAMISRIITEFD